jgi:hypothetical protein
MEKIDRYPGVKPFSLSEKSLFFGRDEDVNLFSKYVEAENLTVLYAKSGMGKSSILQAGILPIFIEYNYLYIPLRFSNYNESLKITPLEKAQQILKPFHKKNTFLNKVEAENITLWQIFKNISLNNPTKKLLIIFDQFEELFSYPHGIEDFILELADIINKKVPKKFKRTLRHFIDEKSTLLTENEFEFIDSEINLKIIISIRSDKLSLVNRLSKFIPHILKNCYELRPLNKQQAIEAIIRPAQLQDSKFKTEPFSYDESCLQKIFAYILPDTNKHTEIETFQLQLLCQHIEKEIVNSKHKTIISTTDVGDISNIYEFYYDNILSNIQNPSEKKLIQVFIEDALIFEDEQRRLSLDEGVIMKRYCIKKEMLAFLVDNRLIRSDISSTGATVYEICHDSLVAPILRSKNRRKEIERLLELDSKRKEEINAYKKEQEKKFKEQQEKEKIYKLITKLVIIPILVLITALGILYDKYTNVIKEKKTASKYQEVIDSIQKVNSILFSDFNKVKDLYLFQLKENLPLVFSAKDFEKDYRSAIDKYMDSFDYSKAKKAQLGLLEITDKDNSALLADRYSLLALYQILDFEVNSAKETIKLAKGKCYECSMVFRPLVLIFLLDNDVEKAKQIYESKKETSYEDGVLFKQVFYSDFLRAERKGILSKISNKDIEEIKNILK